jgi:ubiquinone/menaquinone biosynthesis C-methylase UbiE
MRHKFLLAALLLLPFIASAADKEKEKPVADAPDGPPLTEYMGRRIAQTMHWSGADWLTREKRDAEENTALVFKMLGVKEGMTICDLGAGNGYYSLHLADMVGPNGKVIAEEVQPEMLELLKKRAEKKGVKNLQLLLGTYTDPKLPPGSCDMILLVDVYHEFDHPIEMLRRIRSALKPGGRVAQLEFRSEDDNVPIRPEHKMSKEQVNKELAANGFKLVGQFDELPWQHLLFFGRDDSPEEKVELKGWKPGAKPAK